MNLKSFEGNNMKAWLTRIAANKCKDYLKSAAKRQQSTDPEDLKLIVDEYYSPHNELLKKASYNIPLKKFVFFANFFKE
jgi:RNA polymerase sigma-70 factor (ECF subfamily)